MRTRNAGALGVLLVALVSIIALGAGYAGRRAAMPQATAPQAGPPARQSGSSPVNEIRASAVSSDPSKSPPPLDHSALNTPPVVLNSVNGVMIESQEVKPLSDRFAMLTLKLKNMSAKPIAQIVFAKGREEVNDVSGLALRSADFTDGELFRPGAEITYRFSLPDNEPPLVTRVAAVVYGDASGEGDKVVKGVFAARYAAFNAELASLLEEVRGAAEKARAAGKADDEAASSFADDLKRRSDEVNNDVETSAEKKRVYAAYAQAIRRFGKGGEGLSAFAAKLGELMRDRPTSLPQPAASR
jgi:hypothetical protein